MGSTLASVQCGEGKVADSCRQALDLLVSGGYITVETTARVTGEREERSTYQITPLGMAAYKGDRLSLCLAVCLWMYVQRCRWRHEVDSN